jgi:hypothetical protein
MASCSCRAALTPAPTIAVMLWYMISHLHAWKGALIVSNHICCYNWSFCGHRAKYLSCIGSILASCWSTSVHAPCCTALDAVVCNYSLCNIRLKGIILSVR